MSDVTIPLEYLLFLAFGAGAFVARNEIQHHRVCQELGMVLDHLGIKRPKRKRF